MTEVLALATVGIAFLTALAALRQSASAARRADLDTLRAIIDEIQEKNKELKKTNETLRKQLKEISDTLDIERRATDVQDQRLDELVRENQKLHQYIGELRERMRTTRIPGPKVLAIMRRIPVLISELRTDLLAAAGVPKDLIEKALTLETLVNSIPVLIEELREDT
jgi:chromosome segregation ATPase